MRFLHRVLRRDNPGSSSRYLVKIHPFSLALWRANRRVHDALLLTSCRTVISTRLPMKEKNVNRRRFWDAAPIVCGPLTTCWMRSRLMAQLTRVLALMGRLAEASYTHHVSIFPGAPILSPPGSPASYGSDWLFSLLALASRLAATFRTRDVGTVSDVYWHDRGAEIQWNTRREI